MGMRRGRTGVVHEYIDECFFAIHGCDIVAECHQLWQAAPLPSSTLNFKERAFRLSLSHCGNIGAWVAPYISGPHESCALTLTTFLKCLGALHAWRCRNVGELSFWC